MLKKKFTATAIALATAAVIPLSQVSAINEGAKMPNDGAPYTAAEASRSLYDYGAVKAPQSPKVISAVSGDKGMTVTWEPVSGAYGYVLYRYSESTGHYKYFYIYTDSFTWDDYSENIEGYRYYILSFVKDGDKNVLSDEVDFTDMISDEAGDNTQKPAKVNITKAGKAATAVRIYWNPIDCSGYEVYMLDNGSWRLMKTVSGTTGNYRISGLKSSTKYTFKIRAFNNDANGNPVYGEYSDEYRATTKPSTSVAAPAKVNITKAGKATTAVRIYWNPIDCSGYEIYMLDNGSWKLMKTVSGTTGNYRISGLKSSTKYTFKIRAFNNDANGNPVYGAYSDEYRATTKPSTSVAAPAKVNITKAGKAATAVRIYWNPIDCSGYEIYMLDNGSWRLMKTVSGTTGNYRISGLKSSTKYTFKIRAFNNDANGNPVYGAYSDEYRATTKPSTSVAAPAKVNITKAGKAATAVRIYWNPIDCSGYEIYMLDNGSWKLMKTVSGTTDNYRISGLNSSTKYTFKIRAFNNDANGNPVYGAYSDEYSATTKAETTVNDGATYINGILVVNKTYSLPSSYNPGGLTAETEAAFKKMQQAAWNDGITLWVASGFRSYSYQKQLYDSYVARDGKAAAEKYSARAGHSEHQTGLAIDINNPSSSFIGTAEAKWIEKNCAKYGFIIRYPKDKESKTGFQYEPWHVRYVGKSLAQKLTDSGLCLEEYLGITSVYSD